MAPENLCGAQTKRDKRDLSYGKRDLLSGKRDLLSGNRDFVWCADKKRQKRPTMQTKRDLKSLFT